MQTTAVVALIAEKMDEKVLEMIILATLCIVSFGALTVVNLLVYYMNKNTNFKSKMRKYSVTPKGPSHKNIVHDQAAKMTDGHRQTK